MNQYWHNLRTNTKKVPHVRLQKYLAKKQQSRSRKNLNFPAPIFCTFSVFYAIYILKSAHLVTYKIAWTTQYY